MGFVKPVDAHRQTSFADVRRLALNAMNGRRLQEDMTFEVHVIVGMGEDFILRADMVGDFSSSPYSLVSAFTYKAESSTSCEDEDSGCENHDWTSGAYTYKRGHSNKNAQKQTFAVAFDDDWSVAAESGVETLDVEWEAWYKFEGGRGKGDGLSHNQHESESKDLMSDNDIMTRMSVDWPAAALEVSMTMDLKNQEASNWQKNRRAHAGKHQLPGRPDRK